jgi:hypothetical protein
MAFSTDNAPCESSHQIALAAVPGYRMLADRLPLRAHVVVLRIPSVVVARSLEHGSSSDAALQDVAMLLQTA